MDRNTMKSKEKNQVFGFEPDAHSRAKDFILEFAKLLRAKRRFCFQRLITQNSFDDLLQDVEPS